jgi:hypothetical protein
MLDFLCKKPNKNSKITFGKRWKLHLLIIMRYLSAKNINGFFEWSFSAVFIVLTIVLFVGSLMKGDPEDAWVWVPYGVMAIAIFPPLKLSWWYKVPAVIFLMIAS